MKKLISVLSLLLIGFAFTSCEDELTASTLEGTWEGDMAVYSEWNGEYYYSNYTELEFLTDPLKFTSGKGYWIDHYSNAPWDYYASHIEWKVKNRVIYIYFVEDDTEVEIWDYRLNNNYFDGTIHEGSKSTDFELDHTSSPHWDSYNYGWNAWDIWGTRAGTSQKPIRHFGTK